MSEFFNWEMLGTYAGCTAAVGVITQFIKGIGVLNRIPTQVVTYVLALVLMLWHRCLQAASRLTASC